MSKASSTICHSLPVTLLPLSLSSPSALLRPQSREERKVEQYVKMFSSMEAQQARPRRKEEEAEAGQGGRGKKKTGRLSSSLQWDDT